MGEIVSPERGFVVVEGGRLYYEVAGMGHPLVLVHADVADHRMWDDQFAVFAQRYRVVRYDKRGFGQSTSQDVAFSPRQDIADLLKHLGVETSSVVGLSNGGQIAIDFTLERPELVDALVVVAAGISGNPPSATDAERQLLNAYIALQERQDVAALVESGIQAWGDGPGQPQGRADVPVRERLREMMAHNFRSHHERLESRGLEPPAIDRLGELHVPTLVIVG